MSDLPETAAELEAWIEAHRIYLRAKNSLGLLRSNIKQLELVPDSNSLRAACQHDWEIVKAAAEPR